ncbi:Mrp/NBP35 family ATP-binding protein [Ignicoccus hospitalis]|uniref:Iron-sulfur cluster carrier protein n=1 Tax=Ignicoccus hospitalis (strain KIN4/I / DSM 18386 / JCM 14125) TaxID=453591 RepID=A8AAI7_IGNH4|nr:Mrp/NBP35 family ATP-binding protein [Ignicoccus hospitalis]ABU81939.1 ATPase involved in chromosome partitioning-like protein [Ignicoccus hospitalis KIN4/I]
MSAPQKKLPFRPIQEIQKSIADRLSGIKYKIAVMSGKGGVGKSFVTANLAFALAYRGKKVVVLDADFYGPSIPKMMGVEGQRVYATPEGLIPVTGPLGVKIVSVDFMLPDDEAPVIWRGPMLTNAMLELLENVLWGEADYMLIDLPPGTGDAPLTVAQMIPNLTGAIIVTIPSEVSQKVVMKSVNFAKRLNVPILGIVENMSGFTCPCDGKTYPIFGSGGGKRVAERAGVDFLGSIPLDPRISESNDKGIPFFVEYPDTPAAKAFLKIADKIVEKVEKAKVTSS